jgi:hypothetical protein
MPSSVQFNEFYLNLSPNLFSKQCKIIKKITNSKYLLMLVILDEDDFLDPFGALNKVKARKIRMVIFISNFFSSLQCFAGLA